MTEQAHAWFKNVIIDGLTVMTSLRLEGAPPAETINVTATAWINVLWVQPTNWNQEQDEGRLRDGFNALMGAVTKWPAPRQLMGHLPSRVEPKIKNLELQDIRTADQVAKDREKLSNMLKQLYGKVAI